MKYQATVNVSLTIELEADDEDDAQTKTHSFLENLDQAMFADGAPTIVDSLAPMDLEAIEVQPVEDDER